MLYVLIAFELSILAKTRRGLVILLWLKYVPNSTPRIFESFLSKPQSIESTLKYRTFTLDYFFRLNAITTQIKRRTQEIIWLSKSFISCSTRTYFFVQAWKLFNQFFVLKFLHVTWCQNQFRSISTDWNIFAFINPSESERFSLPGYFARFLTTWKCTWHTKIAVWCEITSMYIFVWPVSFGVWKRKDWNFARWVKKPNRPIPTHIKWNFEWQVKRWIDITLKRIFKVLS